MSLKSYLKNHQIHLVIMSLFIVITIFLRNVPYINLFVNSEYGYITLWIVFIVLFKAPLRYSFIAAGLVFIGSLIPLLSANIAALHEYGHLVFLLLVLGLVGEFKNLIKDYFSS